MPGFEPSLDLQKAIRSRLIARDDLLSLIPADNIRDATGRAEVMPCINVGEGYTSFGRFHSTTFATLHVWIQEAGLTTAKQVGSILVDALRVDAQISGVLTLDNFICHDLAVTRTQFLRDPHGDYSHGILTVAGIVTPK